MFDQVICKTTGAISEFDVRSSKGAAVRGHVEDCFGVGFYLGGALEEEGRRELVDVVVVGVG